MKYLYEEKPFRASSLEKIGRVNAIVGEYQAAGFSLTLRQVYYQFVARGWVANSDREYKNLGGLISDGRLAGLIDWWAIEDRTRYVRDEHGGFESVQDAVEAVAGGYTIDLWQGQKVYVEAWIEKDALVGILEAGCRRYRCPHFSCRGYVSQTAMYNAAQRMIRKIEDDGFERVVVIHLGDHDPSGIDMTRDITDRLELFMEGQVDLEVDRIALNMDQVDRYNPPPNPAKLSDSRGSSYVSLYGRESWELDALEPQVLADLVENRIVREIDRIEWNDRVEQQRTERANLQAVANRWDEVVQVLG